MASVVACIDEEFLVRKLKNALFREPWLAYRVADAAIDDCDNFEEWDLEPISGATLSAEQVNGPFEGLFIVAAQEVLSKGVQPCYLDLALPERIAEHRFVETDGRIRRLRGRRTENGTVIPSIGIEKLGDYTLFFAKEDPLAGIDVLRNGIAHARHGEYLANDLASLLADQKRYNEAIEALSMVIEEGGSAEISPILHLLYKRRLQLFRSLGRMDEAEADKRRYALAFQKNYGHPPGPLEM